MVKEKKRAKGQGGGVHLKKRGFAGVDLKNMEGLEKKNRETTQI
jgi:hypothetical protein